MKTNLYFILLFFLQFFELTILVDHFWYYVLSILLIIPLLFVSIKKLFWGKSILIYLLFVFVSCISSYIHWKQPIIGTFIESYPYIGLASYFLLAYVNNKGMKYDTEKTLLYLGFTFVICYIIQVLVYPSIVFVGAGTSSGIWSIGETTRIRLAGSALSVFVFFYGLSKFVNHSNRKNLLVVLIGSIPLLLMGFRSQVILLVILSILYLIREKSNKLESVKFIMFFCILAVFVSQIPFVQSRIVSMMERQLANQTFSNEDYIRYIELDYYLENVFTEPTMLVFGSGKPIYGTDYFKVIEGAFDQLLYWNDWGIIGLSWIIGVVPVILIVYFVVRSLYIKLPREYVYCKYILSFLLLSSVSTSMEIYRNGNLIIMGAILFLIDCKSKDKVF